MEDKSQKQEFSHFRRLVQPNINITSNDIGHSGRLFKVIIVTVKSILTLKKKIKKS